jgi:hypothetical protein
MADPPDLVVVSTLVTSEGIAVYPIDALTLKKDLEAGGVRVEFEHPASQRGYKRLYGDTREMVVSFAVGLGSSGAVAALQSLAALGGSRNVKITATRSTATTATVTDETFEYEGPAKDAERIICTWHDDQRSDGILD